MRTTTAILAALAAPVLSASPYVLKDDLTYQNFFSSFDFFTGADPTNGFVQYQARDAAAKQNLIGYLNDTQSVFLGVDHTTSDPKGRASVRLESKKTWNQGLLIADIKHMPDSECGTWPAFWMLGVGADGKADWPTAGEVDILEGVNLEEQNSVTLHTSAGCTISNSSISQGSTSASARNAMSGTISTPNCDVNAANQDKNVGCSIKAPKPQTLATYGTDFNNAGGGVYAMEWTTSGITVWFLPRNSSLTASLTSSSSSSSNSSSPDPTTFGTPLAKFSGSGCDYTKSFNNMKLIFNTAFCGDWAGKEWDTKGCKASTGVATCEEYVQQNPDKFAEAYFEVGGLRWYEQEGAAAAATTKRGRSMRGFKA